LHLIGGRMEQFYGSIGSKLDKNLIKDHAHLNISNLYQDAQLSMTKLANTINNSQYASDILKISESLKDTYGKILNEHISVIGSSNEKSKS